MQRHQSFKTQLPLSSSSLIQQQPHEYNSPFTISTIPTEDQLYQSTMPLSYILSTQQQITPLGPMPTFHNYMPVRQPTSHPSTSVSQNSFIEHHDTIDSVQNTILIYLTISTKNILKIYI